ncbi:efflux transporter outer membrane subunit [Legionella sp. km772]|uniref:efflux transporter outer membrane subunit n=1 Tax=Legionella sp. km772 TaxID=2498111 RepID=UPI000F8E7976|nr:efflux transporter outer membrane subunit [Legionella sp. km772]RUR13744.1 efflux transporter outer membrane subunit [Legionella sp. km772]
MLRTFTLMLCLFLCSCMVGPNYKEPQKTIAEHWPQKNASVKETPFKDVLWWRVFKDPTLTELIKQGYKNNISIQIAGTSVLQARAQLAQTVGELYPQQQGMIGNYTYNRIGGSSLESILPTSFDTAALGFSASWELDFWGKYRRAIQSNDAAFLASVAAYDNALITLTSDIATSYTKIRTTEKLIKVTNANIVVQKMSLKIALARYNAGEVSLVDVEQAKTELAQTQASLPPYINDLQTQKDTIAVLLGTIPNGVDGLLKKSYGIPKAPYSVAVGIPKETIARRPDIHKARLQAVQQGAAIGAIKAELFPALSLVGSFTFSSSSIGSASIADMFNWSNRTITAGPSLAWSLLNYGQITNAVRVQDAVFQQALLNYVNLVLQAQKEVQDNISAYIQAKAAVYYLTQANNSATKSLQLAIVRYKEGETDFTPVLNAEQQLLSVQTSLVNAQGNIPEALIALYRSLGGGWQIRGFDDVIPQKIKDEMAARTNWGTLLKQQNHMPPMTKAQRIQQLYLPKW